MKIELHLDITKDRGVGKFSDHCTKYRFRLSDDDPRLLSSVPVPRSQAALDYVPYDTMHQIVMFLSRSLQVQVAGVRGQNESKSENASSHCCAHRKRFFHGARI